MKDDSLNRQIELASAAVRKRCKYFPHEFPLYNAWCTAKQELEEARKKEKDLRDRWNNYRRYACSLIPPFSRTKNPPSSGPCA